MNKVVRERENILPSSWNLGTINEITHVNPEALSPSKTPDDYKFEYIDIASIVRTGKILDTKLVTFSEAPSRARRIINKGDTIVSTVRPYLKGFAQVKNESIYPKVCSTGFAVLRAKKDVDPDFIYQTILSDEFVSFLETKMTGSNYPAVKASDIKEYKLAIPPLREQKKIAVILTSVDNAIEKTEEIIEQTENVKKGLMQQLLTKGIGHTKFKKTEIGEIPEKWNCVPLSKLLKVQGGYAFKSKDSSENGVRWLKIANVGIGEVKWEDESFLPNEFAVQHSDFLLDPNDIVMAMTRPVIRNETKVAWLTEKDVPSLLNQRVCRFQLKNEIYDEFFYHFARSHYFANEILLKIAGTDPPNVSGKQIESILIALPSIKEQRKISEILSLYDDKIINEKQKLIQLQIIKIGLMQVLLTGKVRVKVDKEEVTTS